VKRTPSIPHLTVAIVAVLAVAAVLPARARAGGTAPAAIAPAATAAIAAATPASASVMPLAKPVAAATAAAECNGSPDHSPCPKATPGPASVTTIDGVPVTPGVAPFAKGEVLTYDVEWMGISVGQGTSRVEPGVTYDGKTSIHLTASGSSSRSFALFYSGRGASESWIDPKTYASLGWVSDQKDGSNVDKQTWVMDYVHALAHRNRIVTQKNGSISNYDLDIPLTMSNVQDAYSMTYFYRAFPLKVGQKLESDVFTDKKIWKLTVEVLGKEKVKTDAGTFDCVKVKPTVSFNGVPEKKNEATMWVTDDERRIPVKVQSSTTFGKVNAELVKFSQGAKDDPPATISAATPSATPKP
jgi:hypothetical protein